MNNPIKYTDPTGLAPEDCCGDEYRFRQMIKAKGGVRKDAENYADKVQATVGKYLLRFLTPVEDLVGLAFGKDFDNNDYIRAEAGGWAAASFIPFAKLGKLGKVIKIGSKQFDNLGDFYKATSKLNVGERVAKYKEVGLLR